MALLVFARLGRWLRNVSVPGLTFISFCLMLMFMFILYQPTPGPGILQRLGWQSWDTIDIQSLGSTNTTGGTVSSPPQTPNIGQTPHGVDWWNVTTTEEVVDQASLPLDVWAPLMPHDTGLSEIAVTRCFVNPRLNSKLCDPDTTSEKDAIRGNWVRVDRNLNYEAGYFAGYLNIFYRRTRRQDVNLITDIKLFSESESPSPSDGGWKKVPLSLRTGVMGAPALYMWYKVGKTSGEMTVEERSNIITELDVLYGDDIPWYGFEKLVPATMLHRNDVETTWLTMRRGVKLPPRAPPLHFSRDGRFKILQIADLHYSTSAGVCRHTPASLACPGSDNLTTTSLIATVLSIEKPDLVVFTGDQLNGQGTSWDPKSVLAKFSRAVTEAGIPWAVVFGNHDEETGYVAKAEQVRLMQSLPYSLVQAGPKDIHGVGNYLLKVRSADASKTHLFTLYFLDSGSYSKGAYNFWGWFQPTAYDWIRQSQTDWFLQESASIEPIQRPFTPDTGKDLGHIWRRQGDDQLAPQMGKLAKPNAMMFFHMPLPETYHKADIGSNKRPLDIGISGLETKGDASDSDGFFDKGILKAMESDHVTSSTQEVKVIGNGHCHLTENCRRVKGVWFCFGGGGSYSGYGKLGFDRRFRIYDISDFGETIRTYKRTEHDGFQDSVIDDVVLVGKGART
ncbi:AIP3 domain-containing protein [Favolaschia claudopus]|uniref:AIP3 domain-containing protein n=1 Tax=Favolaschia claudopus TaxID=2862362 RepID=A0AAW0BWS7_9AGAR